MKTALYQQNKKFLDNYLGKIEDHSPKQWMKNFKLYQMIHFSEDEDLYKDKIFSDLLENCKCPTKKQIRKLVYESTINNLLSSGFKVDRIPDIIGNTKFNLILGNMNTGSYRDVGCTQGAEIEANAGSTLTTAGWNGFIYCSRGTGTADRCYDEIALRIFDSDGNYRVGIYNDDGTADDLLAESGSLAMDSAYTYVGVTEFTLDTTNFWMAAQVSSSTGDLYYQSNNRNFKSQSFGAFPNPLTGESTSTGNTIQGKARHS